MYSYPAPHQSWEGVHDHKHQDTQSVVVDQPQGEKLVQVEIWPQTWDVAITSVGITASGRRSSLMVLRPAALLIFNSLSEAWRIHLGRGPTGSEGGRHLQQEGISPVSWSKTWCYPGIREGATLCQEECGRTMSLWVCQPHTNREQPYLSMGPSFP